MIDRLRLILALVFLTDEAADRLLTVAGFTRRVTNVGPNRPKSITLTLTSGGHKLLVVISHRLDDGHWRVGCVDLNLPALVFGHNGRPIRTLFEVALALTRAAHFLRLVTQPSCHAWLTPGVGFPNNGYVRSVECMIQIQDPGHLLLTASHTTAVPYQHKSPLVCWGQSTLHKSAELDLSIYDKAAQRRLGTVLPEGIDGTRIEIKIKNPERLATEVMKAGNLGDGGEVVRTLDLATSYAVVRRNLARMTGWGVTPDLALRDLPVAARHLVIGLGSRISKPQAVDKVLADYRHVCSPCPSTLRNVTNRLRAYAAAVTAPGAAALLPEAMDELQWSDVCNFGAEAEYQAFLTAAAAPMEPCPLIMDAWSRTSFHRLKPEGRDIVGRTVPIHSQPWRRNIL